MAMEVPIDEQHQEHSKTRTPATTAESSQNLSFSAAYRPPPPPRAVTQPQSPTQRLVPRMRPHGINQPEPLSQGAIISPVWEGRLTRLMRPLVWDPSILLSIRRRGRRRIRHTCLISLPLSILLTTRLLRIDQTSSCRHLLAHGSIRHKCILLQYIRSPRQNLPPAIGNEKGLVSSLSAVLIIRGSVN